MYLKLSIYLGKYFCNQNYENVSKCEIEFEIM